MKPNPNFITIHNNQEQIIKLLHELVLTPRLRALEWSKITKQTPNMKIGYPGQHLASLITGVEGARTGARGDDLVDGTEVKSCSRVDQLDTCKQCGNKVLRIENTCPHCESSEIKRMDDSKWLFSIKSEDELKLLTETVDRVFLTIADYPNFDSGDFDTIRFQAYEIWNNQPRHLHFKALMTNYYNKIFLDHIVKNPNKTPAPKNFWPFSYQFYLCNPVKVFSCLVTNANSRPLVNVEYLLDPDADRGELQVEKMPTSLLNIDEWTSLLEGAGEYYLTPQLIPGRTFQNLQESRGDKNILCQILPYINEHTRTFLSLRDTDKAKSTYTRRRRDFPAD